MLRARPAGKYGCGPITGVVGASRTAVEAASAWAVNAFPDDPDARNEYPDATSINYFDVQVGVIFKQIRYVNAGNGAWLANPEYTGYRPLYVCQCHAGDP